MIEIILKLNIFPVDESKKIVLKTKISLAIDFIIQIFMRLEEQNKFLH